MHEIPGFIGKAEQLTSIGQHIRSLAPTPISILITGESGTGKERIARAIHNLSGRKGSFVTIDCGALPPSLVEEELFGHERGSFTGAYERRQGMLEQAQGGTVFLDEIAELPVQLQPRLLRVIQERTLRRIGARTETPIDLRFVSATNADLLQCVGEKAFRNDLYFRLAGFTVKLPPLRERRGDIPLLLQHFLGGKGAHQTFDDAAVRFLSAYDWPGNVRELEHFVQRMRCLVVGKISLDLVYQQLGEATLAEARVQEAQPRTLAEIEQRAIELALADSGGNVALAAQKLGIGRSTLYTYLRKRQNRIGFNGTSNVAEVVLRDRRIVSVSDKACELIGYSRKELLGQTSEVFSNLSDAARKAIYLKWKEQGSVTGVYALRHRKGVPIEVMFETTTLPNGDCRCLWLPIRENGKGS